MPLPGRGHSDHVKDEAPYFETIAELDAWFARPHDKLNGVLSYQPRPHIDSQSDSKPRLLVCHDYKGGYVEYPSGLAYTFNFWQYCDTFIYFSHHRVAVPPSGWTNAAHRQGAKMLGTLILEHSESQPDSLQLIVGSPGEMVKDDKIPISRRYAALLAELAHQRGFDGYLLNFEYHLRYRTNEAHALTAWILLLKAELRARIGSHAEVMWYDSVMYNGVLRWQNRLNALNLPFFLASDTFFTNYSWEPDTQHSMLQYFQNLRLIPARDTLSSETPLAATKTLQTIHTGVDVWPSRNQYGNGGLATYRALTYTSPLGFSAAVFAPGWTWEELTQNPEKNWNTWWENDRKFWLGPLKPGDIIPVLDSPEGPFKPVTAFFRLLPPPNPSHFVFYTSFSPGVGYSWFVEGKKVLDTQTVGWTDVDKQSSIGDLVWPWPTLSWDDITPPPVTGSTAFDMTDGYNGGNTLKLTLTYDGTKPVDKSVWLPIQSVTVSTRKLFEARIIYKMDVGNDVDVDGHIYVKSLPSERHLDASFTVGQANLSYLTLGWTQQTIQFTSTSTHDTASVAIGFLLSVKSKNLSAKATFSISVDQLAVYPTPPPPNVSAGTPSVTDGKFAPATGANPDAIEGVLTWDTVSTLPQVYVVVDNPESVVPVWLLDDTPAYRFPSFVYFNVYAALLTDPEPSRAAFIGTTGLDGRANRFYVERSLLPAAWDTDVGIRFFVQGVTDRGEVLPWDRSAAVDYRRNAA